MNMDKPVSTFEAFCRIIADYARGHDDFALLLTENVPECRELGAIPEDKIVMKDAAAHSALLRAAGLALAGVKPWVLGRSLELVGGSYAQIREAVAMPAPAHTDSRHRRRLFERERRRGEAAFLRHSAR